MPEAVSSGGALVCLTPEQRHDLYVKYVSTPAEIAHRADLARSEVQQADPELGEARARGEAHGRAVLDATLVGHLRNKYAAGVPFTALAARYHLPPSTVRNAVHGVSWSWVRSPSPVRSRRSRIAQQLRALLVAGGEWSVRQLAERLVYDGDRAVIRASLWKLWKRGEVQRTNVGLYRWSAAAP